jgi:lipoprotein-releasing system ATP-binding protein
MSDQMELSGNSVLTGSMLTKTYQEGKLKTSVLHGVDIDIYPGEKIAILGSSGSGKSTLLHLLGGLDKPTSGEVQLLGKPFYNLSANQRAVMRNQHLGFIYQFHHLLPEFTALENVSMPLFMQKMPLKLVKEKAAEILDQVGLSHRIKHKPSELSGGERQRVAIARALVNNPKCVLADEPTGNLDEENADKVYALMCELSTKLQTSFVVVTHNKKMAQQLDRVYTLHNGLIQF